MKQVSFKMGEKEYHILDTNNNMKLASQGLRKILDAYNELEEKFDKLEKSPTILDYEDVGNPLIMEGVTRLLGLSKADAKELDNMSFSDIQKFYSEVCDKFLNMPLATGDYLRDVNEAMLKSQLAEDGVDFDDKEGEGATDPKQEDDK